jgi:hypothetical protein
VRSLRRIWVRQRSGLEFGREKIRCLGLFGVVWVQNWREAKKRQISVQYHTVMNGVRSFEIPNS